MKKQSSKSKALDIKRGFQLMIRKVFNSEVFGVYEGIIETIDDTNAIIGVTIPDLDDLRVNNCRVMTPCQSASAAILPVFAVGDRVMISFSAFSLKKPVIIGQIKEASDVLNLQSAIMSISNGGGSITIDASGNITITGAAIQLTGDSVYANSEDLTVDDIGAM